MIQFDSYFSRGLKPPTRIGLGYSFWTLNINHYINKMKINLRGWYSNSWVWLKWRSRSKMILFQLCPMKLFKHGDHNDNAGDDSENRNTMRWWPWTTGWSYSSWSRTNTTNILGFWVTKHMILGERSLFKSYEMLTVKNLDVGVNLNLKWYNQWLMIRIWKRTTLVSNISIDTDAIHPEVKRCQKDFGQYEISIWYDCK